MECPVCLNLWNIEENVPRILGCGHSLCQACISQLIAPPKIECPTCSFQHNFQVAKMPSEPAVAYTTRCVDSLTKNFTLISLLDSRSRPTQVKKPSLPPEPEPSSRSFSLGQRCPEHKLMIHSFTERPYSLLCDKCIEGISDLRLAIRPFPQVVATCRSTLEQVGDLLKTRQDTCTQISQGLIAQTQVSYQDITQQLDEHFQVFNLRLQEAYQEAKSELSNLISSRKEELDLRQASLKSVAENLSRIDTEFRGLDGLTDAQVVSQYDRVNMLHSRVQTPLPDIETSYNRVQLKVNTPMYESVRELLLSSYQLSLEKVSTAMWNCSVCKAQTPDGEITCRTCKSFRPLSTYPNLLTDPAAATTKEVEELQARRKAELELISQLDSQEPTGVWYIINSDWITEWKNFIFNKPSHNRLQNSTNKNIGTLPTGPISNSRLFVNPDNPTELKPKLKPVAHYRGVNERVWNTYFKIYGGGPIIARRKLNIYDEAVPMDNYIPT